MVVASLFVLKSLGQKTLPFFGYASGDFAMDSLQAIDAKCSCGDNRRMVGGMDRSSDDAQPS
jgi:hypothetical protein